MEALKESTRDFKHFLKKLPEKRKSTMRTQRANGRSGRCFRMSLMPKGFLLTAHWALPGKTLLLCPVLKRANGQQRHRPGNREWDDLIDEFRSVRKSTEWVFSSFSDETTDAKGIASGNPINVLTLGFLCAGHLVHHIYVIKEKYLQE